jgi:hypothetical protein
MEERSSYIGICSPEEASSLALNQLSASGCGITAVLSAAILCNLMTVDDVPTADISACVLRKRAENAPLPQYLHSRHNAGCTGEEVAASFNSCIQSFASVRSLTPENCPHATFIPFVDISVPLIEFFESHFQQGDLIIATLNLQLLGNDAWHHQLVYGMNRATENVFLMNPLGECSISLIQRYVSTPSVLLIRRADIVSRYATSGGDYRIYEDSDWEKFRVAEQIKSVMVNSAIEFVVIPAAYVGGFTVVKRALKNY